MSDSSKFWVVWQPESGAPHHRHVSRESAIKEAERLSECSGPREFYVLEAISVSRKVTVQTTELTHADIPIDTSALPF